MIKKKMATKIKKATTVVKEEKVNSCYRCNHYKTCSLWEDIHRTITKGLASKISVNKEDKTMPFNEIEEPISYSFSETTAKHCPFFNN